MPETSINAYRWRVLLPAAAGIALLVYVAMIFSTGPGGGVAEENTAYCNEASCCFAADTEVTGLSIGFASPLTRIYTEPPFCRSGQIAESGQVALAANEFESIQLVLLAVQDMQDVSVTVSPLRAQASTNPYELKTEVRVVGHVSQVKSKVKGSRVGWQPDPLLPNRALALSANRPQAFLLTVESTPGTTAGRYTGTVEISVSGQRVAKRELQVDVWDFALPATSEFKTAAFSYYRIADDLWPAALGFEPASDDMKMSRFLELAELGFRNRLPPLGFIANGLYSEDRFGKSGTRLDFPLYRQNNGVYEFDREQADKLIEYLKSRHASHFFIAFTSDIYKEPETAAAREMTLLRYLRDYHAYLKDRNLLDQVYVYNIDEPWDEAVEHAGAIYRLIKEHFGSDLRVMQNTNQNNRRIVGTLLGNFDVLDINLGFYHINEIDAYRRRYPEQLGELWWNLNLWPDSRPNLFLEYPLIDARILGPMSYKYHIQGFEYWDLAVPYSVENYFPLGDDVLKVDWRVGENSLDGLLAYPNLRNGFFSSLRLESFRDGMEDQEYLYLLEKLDPENRLLDVPVVRSIQDYETSVGAYLEYRRQLAQAIEQSKNPVSRND